MGLGWILGEEILFNKSTTKAKLVRHEKCSSINDACVLQMSVEDLTITGDASCLPLTAELLAIALATKLVEENRWNANTFEIHSDCLEALRAARGFVPEPFQIQQIVSTLVRTVGTVRSLTVAHVKARDSSGDSVPVVDFEASGSCLRPCFKALRV